MARPRSNDQLNYSALLQPASEFTSDIQRVLLRCGEQERPSLSISEQIASRLARMIVLDQLKPGQRVIEDEISAALHISRSPVREALRILERDRLLIIVPHKGAYVSTYSPKELADIFEIRASLITATYETMLRDHPTEFSERLRQGVAGLEEAARSGSFDVYAMASFRLTTSLRSLCDNKLLYDMVQSLALQMLRYSRLGFGTRHGIERSVHDWKAIARAVSRGDADLTTELLRRRMRGSRDAALASLHSDAPQLPPSGKAAGITGKHHKATEHATV